MVLGNIIYQDELVNHKKVEYLNYVQSPISFRELNTDIPTLIVGWYGLKENNSEHELIQAQSILDKKIISNVLYWEFSFKENKGQHVEGVNKFVVNAPEYYFKPRYNYVNIDPVFFGISSIDDLNNMLAKEYDAVYNFKGKMLYLLRKEENNNSSIIGIDLDMYEHFEFNMDELIQTLHKKVPIDQIHNDFDGELHENYYKKFPYFDQLKRYMVVFLSN